MSSTHKFLVSLGIVSFLSIGVSAQSVTQAVNRLSAEGVSFNYPAGFSIADESTTEAQRLILTQKDSSVKFTIVSRRTLVQRSEVSGEMDSFTEPLVREVEAEVGLGGIPTRTILRTPVGLVEAEGVRLRSASKTGEVIWFRTSSRLTGLAFVRSDKDESEAVQFWQTIRYSIKVEGIVIETMSSNLEPSEIGKIDGGVLNGNALALPKPDYPPIARAAHAAGTVVVRVVIDEEGNVTSARAISGHPLLQAASVGAARYAKFSTTFLKGEPVKVTGVITYNFVAQ
jgi:TonB family protein